MRGVTIRIFALMGLLSALASVIATARLGAGTNSLGTLTELSVIAAAVIGGASLAGGVGTAAGAVLGLVIAVLFDSGRLIQLDASVYFIDHLPIKVNPLDFIIIVLASLAVATLATLYPSRRAADLNPVEAIRHE